MKCNAGIWIDTKQLLPHTKMLVASFNEFDRDTIGRELIRLNVEMVRDFALAYRLRDESYSFEGSGVSKNIKIKGHKRECLDRFIGDLQAYEALIEFAFENLEFIGAKNKRKRNRKHRFFIAQIAKIESGIEKWSRSVIRQVILTVNTAGES